MTEIQIFNNTDFGEIRTLEENGQVLFCGKDIAMALGYKDTVNALKTHCKEDGVVVHHLTDSMGRTQQAKFISEGNLYRLIVNSKLPTAEKFERWVFDEVIPTIHKHGAYMTPETLEAAILNPDTIIKIATALKEEKEKNQLLQMVNSNLKVENAIMTPKAEYFDDLVDRNLLTNFRETAKQLQVKERDFIKFLLEKKYLYRDKRAKLMPYAKHVEQGLFVIKECFNDKSSWSGTQTLVTPKGRETFRLLCIQK